MATRPSAVRRTPVGLPIVGAVLLVLVLLLVGNGVYTESLWFGEVGFGSVYSTMLWTRLMLFALFGSAMAVVVALNIVIAHRVRPPFRPPSLEQQSLDRYRVAIEPYKRAIAAVASGVIGVFAGASASTAWQIWLQWRNATTFGTSDPQFNRDVSFYAFTYPFIRFVVGFGFAVLILALMASVLTHYLYGGIRLQTQGEKVTPAAKAHVSVLLGLIVLLKGFAYYVDQYGLMFSLRGVVQGASYTDVNAKLPALRILIVIAVICSGLFIANLRSRGWALPAAGFGLLLLSAVVIGGVYPAVVQKFQVEPDELARESKFIERNREATLTAYGLDDVEYTNYSGDEPLTAAELRADKGTLPNVRLLDPNKLQSVFEQRQQRRAYYGFPSTLDVDRYEVDGQTDTFILAARELNAEGIPGGSSWVNRHLIYTHGFGLVAAPANTVSDTGEPNFSASFDESGDIAVDQPRIYYGELSPQYSVVRSKQAEIDRPSDEPDAARFTYDGSGGVEIGSLARRAAYALKFRERNLLLSGALTDESRILYVRNPRERVQKVAPYLELDSDPYPVAVDGRILWVVDGYTTTAGFPYAQRVGFGDVTTDSRGVNQVQAEINYIRNSVKATVDAYDGTVTLYEWDAADPVLRTWKKAFPDSLTPRDEMPAGLLAHVRYPEDLFKVQRELLSQYHVDTAAQLFSGNDNWSVPGDPTVEGAPSPQPPYYQYLQLPGDSEPHFQLTTPLSAVNRPNLAAFFTASSDPDTYGRLRVFELPASTNVPAPEQRAGTFESFPEAATELSLLSQRGSQAVFGNLLTLPIGGTLVYVQPVYVQAEGTSRIPALQRVFVGVGNRIGYAPTLAEALDEVFGRGAGSGVAPTPGATTPQPGATAADRLRQAIADANAAFAAGQEALRKGDFAGYGAAQERLRDALERAAQASGAGSPSASPSPAASPTAS